MTNKFSKREESGKHEMEVEKKEKETEKFVPAG